MNGPWIATPSGKTRGRGLGLPFPGEPGLCNAISDVGGVAVGMTTLIEGNGKLVVGKGPVRTGVTAILARSPDDIHIPCAAGHYVLNGNGEMTGSIWLEECGELHTPITITNTHSCGVARDATVRWLVGRGVPLDWGLPVAAETYDGDLNDINGFHVTAEHVIQALEGAGGGTLELGSVGGGTGMLCYDFKGGNGSASRLVTAGGGRYTVGAFVQSNFGLRPQLTILGVPAGKHLTGGELRGRPMGSIIVIIATDAPLAAHQLKRLARRVPLGMARTGAVGHDSSGDIFLAFSTANKEGFSTPAGRSRRLDVLANSDLNPLFQATIEATEESIIDSMIANEAMVGRDGNTAVALPHDRLLEVMRQYRRIG